MWPSTLYEGQEALGVLVEFLIAKMPERELEEVMSDSLAYTEDPWAVHISELPNREVWHLREHPL